MCKYGVLDFKEKYILKHILFISWDNGSLLTVWLYSNVSKLSRPMKMKHMIWFVGRIFTDRAFTKEVSNEVIVFLFFQLSEF